jgi:hypothetical protein
MRELLTELVTEKIRDFEKINSMLLWPRSRLLKETLEALETEQEARDRDQIRPMEVVGLLLLMALFFFGVVLCPR